jgi:DNA-binding HxlR family transcriptional regulator
MKRGYGQYCPLALAAELLCERWTLLIVSRLIDGCSQFNEIHRGVPRISPSLLARRLDHLEHSGLIVRSAAKKGVVRTYTLTPAGRALEGIIDQLAVWGQQWARDMTRDDLDPAFLVWSMHMRLDTTTMPAGRTTLEFEFTGVPTDCRRFWLVHKDGVVDMCLKDPGFEIDLKIESDLRLFVETWRGFRDLHAEIQAKHIRVIGPASLRSAFPKWLRLSGLAPFPRQYAGRERRLRTHCVRRSSVHA